MNRKSRLSLTGDSDPGLATVLFVDDELAVLEGLENALSFEPIEVLTASSAREALAILARTRVHVVVSDENMPGITGLEFLANVCRKYPHIVRIMLTGKTDTATAIKAINDGEVYRFLTKPLDPEELIRALDAAIKLAGMVDGLDRRFHAARSEQAVRDDLENAHPGITRINRDTSGAIVLDLDAIDDDEDDLGASSATTELDATGADHTR